MSAPDTNIEKQKTRHAPTFVSFGAGLIVGAAIVTGLAFYFMGTAGDRAEAVTSGVSATVSE